MANDADQRMLRDAVELRVSSLRRRGDRDDEEEELRRLLAAALGSRLPPRRWYATRDLRRRMQLARYQGQYTGPSGGGPRRAPSPAPATKARAKAKASKTPKHANDEVYAVLRSPDVVVALVEFEVTVGIAPDPSPDVYGEPMVVPDGAWTLTVDLIVEGFARPGGLPMSVDLPVEAGKEYPEAIIKLKAYKYLAGREVCLRAIYLANGRPIGVALRPIVVVESPGDVDITPPAMKPSRMTPTGALDDVDLLVHVFAYNGSQGQELLWWFWSPIAGIDTSVDRARVGKPEEFVASLIENLSTLEQGSGPAQSYNAVVGAAVLLERALPPRLGGLLCAVGAACKGRPPRILLCTEDPYIPWELAWIDSAITPGGRAGFLGAQASVGRWVVGPTNTNDYPVPATVAMKSMIVVAGDFAGDEALKAVQHETAELKAKYGATVVTAGLARVKKAVRGATAEVIHFAVHGRYAPGTAFGGLVMGENEMLDPNALRGYNKQFRASPLVFLNACETGGAEQQLGQFSGLAAEFLALGARAVVAPLWAVNDGEASKIAGAFYSNVFAGSPVAEVLAIQRAGVTSKSRRATPLSYLFYGHPALKMTKEARRR